MEDEKEKSSGQQWKENKKRNETKIIIAYYLFVCL